MIKTLTKEQEALMHQVRKEWIEFCLGGNTKINREIAMEGIRWIYGLAKKPQPITIFVGGPMEAQYACWVLKALVKNKKWFAQVLAQVRDQVRDQVSDQVSAQVRDQVSDQVSDQVRDQVLAQVSDQKGEYFYFSWCDLDDSYWVSFYDFFKRIGVVNYEKFDGYLEYLKSGAFMTIFLEQFAIVCPRPKKVNRDERNRLHGSDSPAVEWENGEKYYLWHGIRVPEKIIMRPHEITKEDIQNERNSEVSRAIAERLGWEEYMERADTVLIDKWFDVKMMNHYELYDFKKRFEMTPKLLKMESPELNDGTRPYYVEPVHPGLKTCQSARRWQFMTPNGKWPEVDDCNKNPELVFEVEA